MRWDLDFMWVSTARAQKYQLHHGVFPLLQQPMPRLPNSNGLWSIVQTCAWSWPKSDCFWIYPQRWRENTLEATKRPHHSCEGLRLTSSWLRILQNRTILGGARYSQYLPQLSFCFFKDGKSGKSNHDASDFHYVRIEKSPQILDKKSTALKTEAPLLLVLDKQCPCPALPKQQAWKTGTNQQQLCGLSINAQSFERLMGVQDNTESEAARIWKKRLIPSCDAVMLHPECWAWPNQAAQPRPLIKFTNHPWPSLFTKWFA